MCRHLSKGGILIFLLFGVLIPPAWGLVGVCSDCHTMHGSQGGVAGTIGSLLTLPNSSVSAGSVADNYCLGCHQSNTYNSTDGSSITSNSGQPIVYTTSGVIYGTNTLAGGDFYWVADSSGNDDNTGHNVVGISGADAIGMTPPGWREGMDAAGNIAGSDTVGSGWTAQLSCYGVYGCHGSHDTTNFAGGHHLNATGALSSATTVGNSFRFLLGIYGGEDSDYELSSSDGTTDHNQYYEVGRTADSSYDTHSMSYLCAECHGDFHSDGSDATITGLDDASQPDGFGSPWYRHPVGRDLSVAGGEYTSYTSYSVTVPVGTSSTVDLPLASRVATSVQTAGNGIVTCLSCHRAHGSPYADLLRWDFRAWPGTAGSDGCYTCHSSKK